MNIEMFLQYEKENDLFMAEVRGFRYWHYIRKPIYDEIIRQNEQIGQAHTGWKGDQYFKRVCLKLKQAPNWIFRNPLLNLEEKDLLVFNHHRRVKNGDYFDCLYTDEILKEIDYSYYVLELPILESHFSPVRTTNMKYLDFLKFCIAANTEVKRKLFRFRLSSDDQKQIRCMIHNMERYLNTKLDVDSIIGNIEKVYLDYGLGKKLYMGIFDKVKPKAVVEVVSYSPDRYVVNEIAQERGIPVIELQHGIMGENHIAYNFARKMDLPTFPDYIFAFGQYWKDNTRLPIEDDKVKVVGWPYYEQKLNGYKQKDISNDGDKKTILFISQGTIGKELSKIAVELFEAFNNVEYRIIYKLHPGEYARWKDEYPWLIDSGIEVIDHNLQDMHYYFAQSDIQVGVYSTAIYEGLGYGLATIIMELYGHEVMASLYESEEAYLAKTAKDVLRIFKILDCQTSDRDMSYFWMANSMDNVKREIDKIIEDER